ncbi:TrkH family potassium uptake protein [Nitrosomonas sp. Nm166]|uniref:TrkH family potassium uptake protein n=1 Tax=Nitrosomonas sp. Nm166 TaxID=1881054 RepID=UPI0008F1645D|nr:TrkH family potassium uptake protein [Nitrosomonas sp. Nm166]SFD89336.1 trk system potassium uptake protein TrkH [Nitrosomonas sp. Nm166]
MKLWDPHVLPYKVVRTAKKNTFNISPPAVLFLGFILLIAIGSLLLKLPFATHAETSWLQSIFTATSAVTVTGLVVLDTGTHFTLFGQIVIALLIQTGGLSFMTFAIVAALSLGTRLGIGQQVIAQEAFNQTSLEKVTHTAKYVLIYSLLIELAGFVLLTLTWLDDLSFGEATYHAFFYTISAFNNAGFALNSNSLMPYSGNLSLNLIITTFIIIGGIGFLVLIDLRKQKRWHKLSVNTKLVLISTLIINFCAFVLIWILEAQNPATLGLLSHADQAIAAWFQAITPRTAGFNTLAIEELTNATTTLMILLMFIGGGSLSTASGLKIGTFVVLIMTTYAFLRRRDDVVVLQRTIPQSQVMKALALTTVSIIMIFLGIFILTIIEKAPFIDIAFEVVSALSTVGLSRGLTGQLSVGGEIVIIFMMIVGRVGPLTFAYFLATPKKKHIKYANADIQVG